jgi:alpha-glucoside transport system substrate-binding protein
LGSGVATGWPGTDWIENLLMQEGGPHVYDRWTSHRLPFDSAPVRRAFERLGRILFTKGYFAEGAIEQRYDFARRPMLKNPPGCWLFHLPSFAAGFLPEGSVGETTDVFPFPPVGDAFRGVVGGGSMIGVFSDRPEVRAVVRFLLGPHYGAKLGAGTASFISGNRRFDVAQYEPFKRLQAKLIYAALADDAFRLDASDLMPPEIGADLFWKAMMRYAAEGPESLDEILTELDTAWPDDTG